MKELQYFISDNSNCGVPLAIQDVWQSFELFAGGPLVGVNTFQATVTCVLYDELSIHTGLVQSAGYAVARGYLVKVAIL